MQYTNFSVTPLSIKIDNGYFAKELCIIGRNYDMFSFLNQSLFVGHKGSYMHTKPPNLLYYNLDVL